MYIHELMYTINLVRIYLHELKTIQFNRISNIINDILIFYLNIFYLYN